MTEELATLSAIYEKPESHLLLIFFKNDSSRCMESECIVSKY